MKRICTGRLPCEAVPLAQPYKGCCVTRGPGCSDCNRIGVTYGYREYLRKGRVRKELRRRSISRIVGDGLAASFNSAHWIRFERGFFVSAALNS